MRFVRKKRALFMDVDNTLIVTRSGNKFPIDNMDWRFKEGMLRALLSFFRKNSKFSYLLLVSNQGGISMGFVKEEDIIEKFESIVDKLRKILPKRIRVDYKYCPNMKGINRKPKPGMAFEFRDEIGISLPNSIMVGDADGSEESFSDSDRVFAKNALMYKFYNPQEFIKSFTK